ncbi:MAG: Sua5/YciO/YrdC/YwlC family protein [Gammaproteobacteria bacterium]|nr:Sua5/YciO/YrdC/YwlC family protein [Gammaproteobacteria bacterium]
MLAAARALRGGGVIAYPTEAVFGLGCDPLDPGALRRLLRLKQRDAAKGLILIASGFRQLRPYLAPIPAEILARIHRTWPGPVTWLMPARPWAPRLLRGGHETLAVRVTAHPVASALCRAAGMAIVSTSANLSGGPPARTAAEVRAWFDGRIDYLLDGPVDRRASPTKIYDARSGRLLRPGGNDESSMRAGSTMG